MAVDPSVVIEGGGGRAAGAGFVGMRRRAQRVRRDAIEVQLVEAEVAEAGGAGEILAALEAEVGRSTATSTASSTVTITATAPRTTAPDAEPVVENIAEPVVENEASAVVPNVTPTPTAARGAGCGIDIEQVSMWLERVQDDLRRVRARVEFLEAERSRLDVQQRLVSELLASSTLL